MLSDEWTELGRVDAEIARLKERYRAARAAGFFPAAGHLAAALAAAQGRRNRLVDRMSLAIVESAGVDRAGLSADEQQHDATLYHTAGTYYLD